MNKASHAAALQAPQPLGAVKFAGTADASGNFAALLDTMAQDQAPAPKPDVRSDDARDERDSVAADQPRERDDQPRPVKADARRPLPAKADTAPARRDDAPPAKRTNDDAAPVAADAPVAAKPEHKAAAAAKADDRQDAQDRVDAVDAADQHAAEAVVTNAPVVVGPVVTPVEVPVAAAPVIKTDVKIPAIKPHGPVVMPTAGPVRGQQAQATPDGAVSGELLADAAVADAPDAAANTSMLKSAAQVEIKAAAAAPSTAAAAPALPKLEAAQPRALDPLLQRLNLAVAAQTGDAAPVTAAAVTKQTVAAVAASTAAPIVATAPATSPLAVTTAAAPTGALAAATATGLATAEAPAATATLPNAATQPQTVNPATVAAPQAQAAAVKAAAPPVAVTAALADANLTVDAGAPGSNAGAGAGKVIALNYPAAASGQAASTRGAGGLASLPAVLQVAVQMTKNAKGGDKSFDIQLHPAELGRVEVKLEIDKNGNVTAHVRADSQAALDQLQRGSAALERALNEAGLKTGGDALNFSLRDDGSQQSAGGNQTQQERQTARQNGPAFAEGSGMTDDDLETATLTLTAGTARVDIRA